MGVIAPAVAAIGKMSTLGKIGLGLSAVGALGSAKGWGAEEGEIKQVSKLSPEQQRLMSPLSQFLQRRLQEGAPAYGGELFAGMTPEQQSALQNIISLYSKGAPMGAEMEEGMKGYLAGTSPEEMSKWYEQYVLPSEERRFREVTLPGIRESYVGPTGEGGYWGSERAKAEALGHERFGEATMQERGEAIMRGREQGLTAMGMIPTMGRYIAEPAEKMWRMGEAKRGIQRERLAAEYAEFIRTQPGAAETINQILAFLGIGTKETMATPGTASPFAGILQAGAGLLGATGGMKAVLK